MSATDMCGKVALVTGAASGIGKATALAFVDVGVSVVIADIDPGGAAVAASIVEGGGKAIFVEADVSRADDWKRVVETATTAFGRLDFAHNNAAWEPPGRPMLWDHTEEDWDRTFAVTAKAVWLGMKAEFPALRETKGAIVNTASSAALRIAEGAGAYNAAKAAVLALSRQAAKEMGRVGVRVNAIAPGIIDTPAVERVMPSGMKETVIGMVPLGRMGAPEDIAAAVVWLCSSQAAYINGATLLADGGLI